MDLPGGEVDAQRPAPHLGVVGRGVTVDRDRGPTQGRAEPRRSSSIENGLSMKSSAPASSAATRARSVPAPDSSRILGPAAQPTHDLDAVEVGQPQVEQDHVRRGGSRRGEPVVGVAGDDDVVADPAQPRLSAVRICGSSSTASTLATGSLLILQRAGAPQRRDGEPDPPRA